MTDFRNLKSINHEGDQGSRRKSPDRVDILLGALGGKTVLTDS
jgi:hypothetical protein